MLYKFGKFPNNYIKTNRLGRLVSAFYEDEEKEVRTKRVSTSVSLPPEMLVAIDRKRGDVPRSKWIFRDLEKIYATDMAKIRKEMGH